MIGVYPHLQAIDLECAARVYPTLEKENQDPNCPNLETQKMQLLRLLWTLSLRNLANQVYTAQGQFPLDENIDRGFTDTPNPDTHNLAYFKILLLHPAILLTPTQSRKIILRPVNTKYFGFLGVGRGTEPRFNL